MRYTARCNALVDPHDPSKGTNIDWWRAAAQRGNASAIKALRAPPFPGELEYLHRWAITLAGRSGVGPAGLAPVSPLVIESTARLLHWPIDARDVEALMLIDGALIAPDRDEAKADVPEEARPERAWPTRKSAGGTG